jgi:hypothetical protein
MDNVFVQKQSRMIDACIVTLDSKNRDIMNNIQESEDKQIPILEKEKEHLKSMITDKSIDIGKRLDMRDRIIAIRKDIRYIKNRRKDYLLDNAEHIFDYFESKKKISEGKNVTTVLTDFFNIQSTDKNEHDYRNTVSKYMSNVDNSYIDPTNYIHPLTKCVQCNVGEMIPVECDGVMVCNECSTTVKYLIDNDKQSYKDPPKEICCYAYKRINHFREILAQFQAKETTQIPDDIIENIRRQIKKERLDISQFTNKRAKDILKRLRYNKYYEHIPFIRDKLGIKPPVMAPELEERLCNLFIDIQKPYAKFCPYDRVNFLNYYYTIYKLCELLDQRHFLPFFPMLKDREKRIEQDETWKKICEELGWEFIPTV